LGVELRTDLYREELSYVYVVTGIDLCSYDGECQAPRLVSGRGYVRDQRELSANGERGPTCRLVSVAA
jgi:hypothetical protein